MPTFCAQCGTQNQDGDKYCLKCGEKLITKASNKKLFLDQTDLPITQPASSYEREAYQIHTDDITSQLTLVKLAFGAFGVIGLYAVLNFLFGFISIFFDIFGSLIGNMVFHAPLVGAFLFLAKSLFNYTSGIESENYLFREGRTIGQLLFLFTALLIIDIIFESIFDYFSPFIIRILLWFLSDSLLLIAFYKFSNWLGTILTLSDMRTSYQPKLLLIFCVLWLVWDSLYLLFYLGIDLDPIFINGVYLIIQLVQIIAGFSIYRILNQIKI
jgi:hypothetical protein